MSTTDSASVDLPHLTSRRVAESIATADAYRPDIDGLRAVAVLSVFAFHMDPDACPGGFVGVDVFFVISGYLISRIILSEVDARRFTFMGFYERRVRRIAPALIGVLVGTSLGAAVLLPPSEYVGFSNSARAAALSIPNFYFWRHTGYFELGSNSLPLLHTWSLAVEEQFYLVFPALFLMGRRLGLGWASIIVPLLGFSLLAGIVQTSHDPTGAFYSPATRAWEFLAGSLIAAGVLPSVSGRAAEALCAIGLVLLAASFVLINDGSPFPGWRALAPCIGSVALVCGGRGALVASPLRLAPTAFVGRISYSLYLWHWPVIVAARIFWGGRFTPAEALGVAVVAIGAAYLSWRWIEQPPRRNRTVFTRNRLFLVAGLAVAVMVGQSSLVNRLHGLPARYGAAAQAFLQAPPWTAPAGCGVTQDACVAGAPAAPPSFAVVGDSMGLALLPGVDLAARGAGRAGLYYAKGGCLPLLGVGSSECKSFVSGAFQRVAADPDVATVLLVGRWTTAVEPRRFGRQNSRTMQLPEAVLVAAFARTRAALGRRALLLLTNIPEQPVDVPTAAANRANLGLAPFVGVSRAVFDRRVRRTDGLLARLGIPALDASSVLCGPDTCIATMAGRSLYQDDNHLNALGAQYLATRGLFAPMFATPPAYPRSSATIP